MQGKAVNLIIFQFFTVFTQQWLETAKRLSSSSTEAHSNYFRKFVQNVVPFLPKCADKH